MTHKPRLALIAVALIATFGAIDRPAAEAKSKDDGATENSSKEGKQVTTKITDRSHPDYIRCRSEPMIGSLVRKRRICMTNSQWAEHIRAGNDGSRSMLDDFAKGGMRQE